MKHPISVCMIVKNEEQQVTMSIPSVSPYVEEIIVVDTGSNDRTAAVAKDLGARVFSYPWDDNFSAARNFSLEQAKQPYVLVLDADECLSADPSEWFADYLLQNDGRAGLVRIHNIDDAGQVNQILSLPRIFPNRPSFRYVRRIHEQLREHGQTPATIETGLVLQHRGYRTENIQHHHKIERNLRLLEREAQDDPHDLYVLFQLAKTTYMAKQYTAAAPLFQQVIDELSRQPGVVPAFLPSLFVHYGYTLFHLRQFADLFHLLEVGVDLYPDYTHLYFLYGQALIECKDLSRMQEIPTVFLHCLRLGDQTGRYETVPGVGSYMAQFNLGVYYEVTGDLIQAREYYRLAATANYAPAKTRLAAIG